jgi:type II secretory pathway component PulF
MIDSGLPLVQCLDIQSKQAPNPTFRKQLVHIKEQVESGATFADALKKYPGTFDELFRNMIAAGEVGGILDTILNRLAQYLEKADKLKRQIKGAMMYPTIVMIVAFVVVALLLLKVVPTFEEMFAEFGSALPAPTQFVVDLSKWLQANFFYVVIGIGGTVRHQGVLRHQTRRGAARRHHAQGAGLRRPAHQGRRRALLPHAGHDDQLGRADPRGARHLCSHRRQQGHRERRPARA